MTEYVITVDIPENKKKWIRNYLNDMGCDIKLWARK